MFRSGQRLLLAEDGRWDGKLTVPGTTVRSYETGADQALRRLLTQKFGLEVNGVTNLRTSFMLPGNTPAMPKVFDDRHAFLASEKTNPVSGLTTHLLTLSDVHDLVMAGQVEPNAKALLESYL